MKRPLVETKIRTEFGDVLETDVDLMSGQRDLTYIPGFSDQRQARDLELADIASGKKGRHEASLAPLEVNCHWVRSHTPAGAPDGRKQVGYGNSGYKVVDKSQIGKTGWLKELPPGATIEADGSIRKGDTILMVADAKTASQNAARKALATKRLTSDTEAAMGGLVKVGARADAYVRKEA